MMSRLDQAVRAAISVDGVYLLGRRARTDSQPGRYELLGGGVAEGETREAALRRELQEEAGLEFDLTTAAIQLAIGYTSTTSGRRWLGSIIPVELPGRPCIRLNPAEHDHHIWARPEAALAKIPLTPATAWSLAMLTGRGGIWFAADLAAVRLTVDELLVRHADRHGVPSGR